MSCGVHTWHSASGQVRMAPRPPQTLLPPPRPYLLAASSPSLPVSPRSVLPSLRHRVSIGAWGQLGPRRAREWCHPRQGYPAASLVLTAATRERCRCADFAPRALGPGEVKPSPEATRLDRGRAGVRAQARRVPLYSLQTPSPAPALVLPPQPPPSPPCPKAVAPRTVVSAGAGAASDWAGGRRPRPRLRPRRPCGLSSSMAESQRGKETP